MKDELSDYAPTAKRGLWVLGLVALALLVLVSVAHALPAAAGAEASYVVTSNSMAPTLSPGDVIYVYDVQPADVNEGDVISFTSGTQAGRPQVTTHRVAEVREDGGLRFVTKGDNNENTDPAPVTPDNVIGRVPHVLGVPLHVPLLGQFLLFAGSRMGVILLVFIPVALLILNELYVIARGAGAVPSSGSGTGSGGGGTDSDPDPAPEEEE